MPILQFYTFLTELYVTIRRLSNTRDAGSHKQLSRCDITDDAGDWCGSIEVPTEWISGSEDQRFHFIVISHAKALTMEKNAWFRPTTFRRRERSRNGVCTTFCSWRGIMNDAYGNGLLLARFFGPLLKKQVGPR
ncbi:uncharacterized protein F4807DRAFT_408957 [Annulohypoxylon truncatum]|uniref:uncharacterized protein n=1 Tax=Annulohypoxylon truncatum TaxID=327061 RepID=UPI002007D124|nr:uncharacterized protein F4807DRAFT_408957 [Annulohypoxylon truncatum]KAI1213759.1 hypothetical protein F4807DRAFT_408957 [Annulohypoxylon truncatum]